MRVLPWALFINLQHKRQTGRPVSTPSRPGVRLVNQSTAEAEAAAIIPAAPVVAGLGRLHRTRMYSLVAHRYTCISMRPGIHLLAAQQWQLVNSLFTAKLEGWLSNLWRLTSQKWLSPPLTEM